jgi:hypothetical protein
MRTPVVFIIFNRLDTARRVFEVIREAKPPRLFVIADGPRVDRTGESEKCLEARTIIKQVDWECEVQTNFSETNLGCRRRVSSGLNWVFSQVDEVIVLEDDCLPDPSFFDFCEVLLERYRDDERVMHIAGTNYQFGNRRSPYSYYFSRYNHCWGWATWKRAWAKYDDTMSIWPEVRDQGYLKDILIGDELAVPYWRRSFQDVYDGKIDSWSFVWTLSCWINYGLTILPSVNLISNIGFNAHGAHTLNHLSRFANMKTASIEFPISSPPIMARDSQADRYTQKHNFRDGVLIRLGRRLLQFYSRWTRKQIQ